MIGNADPAIDARFREAIGAHEQGRHEAAFALYKTILEEAPGYPPALHMLGVLALEFGQVDAAVEALRAAATAAPERTDYRNDLGEALRHAGDLESAADAFVQVLEIEPGHAGARNNLGIVRHAQGRLDEAVALYREAIALAPDNVHALTNLGVALQASGDASGARRALDAALAAAPENAAVLLNLGNLELGEGMPEKAEALYRQIIEGDPRSAPAHVNLGRALKEQGRVAEALSACVSARGLDPSLPAAHWNEGLCRLLLGDYARGWQGFAWRERAEAVPPHGLPHPAWNGEPLAGRHLLVHAEQGLGDTLQFVRFVPRLQSFEPASVTVLCQSPVVDLIAQVAGIGKVVGPEASLEGVDLRVPLLDLPRHLRIALPDLVTDAPYLFADPAKTALWQARFAQMPRPRVGLVWKGRPQHANDRNRSMPLAALAAAFQVPGITWFSLQLDPTSTEAALLDEAGVVALGATFETMDDTAAAVMALDLVVTVDTSIAHLAGALGKPVWVLLPAVPDWRWLLNRSDSPWYPTAKLFRQPARGDWASVATAICAGLRGLAAG
jgi:Flp pilus assembly protein TadD